MAIDWREITKQSLAAAGAPNQKILSGNKGASQGAKGRQNVYTELIQSQKNRNIMAEYWQEKRREQLQKQAQQAQAAATLVMDAQRQGLNTGGLFGGITSKSGGSVKNLLPSSAVGPVNNSATKQALEQFVSRRQVEKDRAADSVALALQGGGYDTVKPYWRNTDRSEKYGPKIEQTMAAGINETVAGWASAARETVKNTNLVGYGMLPAEMRLNTPIDEAAARKSDLETALEGFVEDKYNKAAEYDAQARADLGEFGNAVVDVGKLGTQILADAATGAPLVSTFIRSAGAGFEEARQSGASDTDELLYGLGLGAIEAATEKMFSVARPLRNIYGRGFLDNASWNKLAGRLTSSPTGRGVLKWLAAAGSEGAEEIVANVLQAPLQRLTIDPEAKIDWGDTLYQGLIGAAMGGILGSGAVVSGRGLTNAKTAAASVASDQNRLASDEEIRDYINYAVDYGTRLDADGNPVLPRQIEYLPVMTVNSMDAKDLSRLFGVDISGYTHVLRDNDVRHLLKKFDVTAMDVANIPDIIQNYDLAFKGRSTHDGKNTVYYVQRHNGTTYYLEQAIEADKVLAPKQMKKVPTGTVPKFVKTLPVSAAERDEIIQNIIALSSSQRTDVPANIAVPREHALDAMSNFDSAISNIIPNAGNYVNNAGNILNDPAGDANDGQSLRDAMPAKASNYLSRAENGFLKAFGDVVGANRFADRSYVKDGIRQMSDEYLTTGQISQATVDDVFDRLYSAGRVIDETFYNDTADVREYLRNTPVSISEGDQANIADWNQFRKQAFGSIRISNSGTPIDKAYQELNEINASLFPETITAPSEQIRRLYEVAQSIRRVEQDLDTAYEGQAEDYRAWAKDEFDKTAQSLRESLSVVRRYLDDKTPKTGSARYYENRDASEDEIQLIYKQEIIPRKETVKRLRASGLLTSQDDYLIDGLTNGSLKPENIPAAPNRQLILDIADLNRQVREYATELGILERKADQIDMEGVTEVAPEFARGIRPQLGDFIRNMETITKGTSGETKAIVKDKILDPWRAAKTDYVNSYKSALQEFRSEIQDKLKIKQGSRESAAVMWLGEGKRQIPSKNKSGEVETEPYTIDDLRRDFDYTAPNGKKAYENIIAAEAWFRQKYAEYVARINEGLRRTYPNPFDENGDLIPGRRLIEREDYFHHYSEMLSGWRQIMQFVESGNNATDIDPALVGVSEFTKPLSRWTGFMQRRKGGEYTEDAVGGMLKYMPAAEYKINIEPMIPRLRAFANAVREGTADSKNANGLIQYLDEFANELAGKTSGIDRFVVNNLLGGEDKGRSRLLKLSSFGGRVRSNAVLGNINTIVSQVLNFPNIFAYVNTKDTMLGIKDTLGNIFGRGNAGEILSQSVFLNERYLGREERRFGVDGKFKAGFKKAQDAAVYAMEIGDQLVSSIAFMGAYRQGLARGVSDPIRYADEITQKAVAGRGIGELPLALKSRTTNFFIPFQVEVNNAVNVYRDIFKAELQKDETRAGKVISGLVKMGVATWLLNGMMEALTGRRPLPDLIDVILQAAKEYEEQDDDEKSVSELAANIAYRSLGEALSAMPGGAVILSQFMDSDAAENMFGESDPTRFGTQNIVASGMADLLSLPFDVATGENINLTDKAGTAARFLLPWGAAQLERFVETGQDYGLLPEATYQKDSGLEIERNAAPGNYRDDGRLRFSLDYGPADILKSAAFGSYATDQGREYTKDFASLGAAATTAYEELQGTGLKNSEIEETLRALSKIEGDKNNAGETISGSRRKNQMEALISSGWSQEQQAIVYKNMLASDSQKEQFELLEAYDLSAGRAFGLIGDLENAEGEKNAEGETISGSKTRQQLEILSRSGLNIDQQAELYLDTLASESVIDTYRQFAIFGVDPSDMYRLQAEGYNISSSYLDGLPEAVSTGISAYNYLLYRSTYGSLRADIDRNGNSISGTKKTKVMNFIDSMDITNEQKDYLYLQDYAESGLWQTPWH